MKKLVFISFACLVAVSTAAVAGEHLVGGPPASGGNTIPFWASQPAMRWQVIWWQTEIGEAGPVTKVEFANYIGTGSSGGTFSGCKMLLCHTSLTNVTAVYNDNYGGNTPVTCFDGTFVKTETASGAWYTLFENPTNVLNYNNTANLLIEVSWTSATGGANYDQRKSSGGSGRVYAYNATASSGSVSSGYAHYARLTIGYAGVTPTSLGRIKGFYN